MAGPAFHSSAHSSLPSEISRSVPLPHFTRIISFFSIRCPISLYFDSYPGSCSARESWLVSYLCQPRHILLWAPCAHLVLVLTVQWDRISQSSTCSQAGLPCLPVANLLAMLDPFCLQTHYYILTQPVQLSILLIQLFVVCSHPLECWVCGDTLSFAKIFRGFIVLLFNRLVFVRGIEEIQNLCCRRPILPERPSEAV